MRRRWWFAGAGPAEPFRLGRVQAQELQVSVREMGVVDPSTKVARVGPPMDGVIIKKGVELGDTIPSGVSSYNAGTVIFTVPDLKSLIIRVRACRGA